MFIADLHIHSCYSRATSKDCVPEYLDLWARRKGIGLLGTGDFTHPAWREELKEKLQPAEEGFYELKDEFRISELLAGREERPRFVLSGEISSIYKKNGRVRKVHNVILLPSLEAAERLSLRLEAIGNLHSDGRPILGLDSRDLLEITLDCCPQAIFIPAHIWTPHFSLFGAFSGFDTIEECFEDMTPYIHALETGLSSDPPMNWRLSALDGYTLVSNSDAHSPAKLGREANLFHTECSYPAIRSALADREGKAFVGTIEFFPEEGKYHFDGHRNCKLCLTPSETVEAGGKCPVCGKKITVGVLHRVESLADRPEGYRLPNGRPYESLIPLPEVIAASMGVSSASAKVKRRYEEMLHTLGPEFYILREAPLSEIERVAGPCVAEGIRRMRCGKVEILPGYDGEYGKIHLLDAEEIGALAGQVSFFGVQPRKKKTTPSDRKKANSPAAPLSDPLQVKEPTLKAPSLSESATFLTGLNEEQKEAVTALERAVAVIAGPGTGKTRTLVSRIAYLIKERGVKPSEITAVTFTNKAAAEMRERLQKELGSKHAVRGMCIGTFHSICLQLLTKRDGAITLLEEYEALLIAEDILRETGEKGSPRKFLHEVSRRKNCVDCEGKTEFPDEAFVRYNARLKEYGVLDFDDLLLETLVWFEEGTGIVPYTKAFSYLLVDELQDINEVQYRLIRAWSKKNKNVFVIGDPDQAIYGFRGSDSNCFARFALDYPGLREIHLVQNYRSTPEILQCALPVISQSAALPGDRLLKATRANGEKVRLCTAGDDFSEAIWIAKEINRLVGGIDMLDAQSQGAEGRIKGFSDIAVLYRTHRQAHVLEKCLRTEGIPYIVVGRESLLSDPQVRGVLGFFRFLLNPQDILSLRICLKAVLHCPEEAVGRLMRFFSENGGPHKPLAARIEECSNPFEEELPLAKWAALAKSFLPHVSKTKPQKLLADFIKESGLTENSNLEQLLHMAVFHGHMAEFLENLTLGGESDIARSSSRAYASDAVSLMTFHGAKGLEFPCVFLCGVRKGLLPLETPGRVADAEEERRLFYVGITRAQEKLVLLTSREPSPFLFEIPENALQKSETAPVKRFLEAEQLSFFV